MPICPQCKKEINQLICIEQQRWKYSIDTPPEVKGRRTLSYIMDGDSTNSFQCPECKRELFTRYQNAARFLRGE